MKIVDNKVWHDGQKIGWVDGHHIRSEADGRKLGYFDSEFIYNENAVKIAYVHENELVFENGKPSVSLQELNEKIEGADSLMEKAAVYVLLED